MNAQDIRNDYSTHNGIITSPGKFEGCPIYAVYFWDAYLNGMADEDDGETLTFHVTPEDRTIFQDLIEVETVRLSEDGSGFVHCSTH